MASLGLSSYLALLAALVWGSWRRPAIALTAVLCLFGLKQWGQSTTALLSEYRQITNYAVGMLVVVGVLRASMARSCLFCRLPPTAILTLSLYLYALLTLVWTPDLKSALEQWGMAAPYLVTVAVLAPLLVMDAMELRRAFEWTALAGGSVCALMLLFGHWGTRGLLLYGDATDLQTNPLEIASLGGTVAIVAALVSFERGKLLRRLAMVGCFLVGVAVVLRSGSRGQLLALGPAFLVAWPVAFRPRNARSAVALIVASVAVGLLGWWASTFVFIDQARWQSGVAEGDVQGRFEMATTLLSASSDSLATMVFGLGNSSAFPVVGYYPHITGLEIIAEEGWVGTLLYGSILVIAARSFLALARLTADDPVRRRTIAMLGAAFTFELILSYKQGSLLSSVYVFLFAIYLDRLRLASSVTIPTAAAPSAPALLPLHSNLMR